MSDQKYDLIRRGEFPRVYSAHSIRLGVLAEEIDPLQGYVTKEDCAKYTLPAVDMAGDDHVFDLRDAAKMLLDVRFAQSHIAVSAYLGGRGTTAYDFSAAVQSALRLVAMGNRIDRHPTRQPTLIDTPAAPDTPEVLALVAAAKRVTSFEDTVQDLAECGCDRCTAHLDLRGALAEIEGEKT